ncbi:hypothetical protein [Streptomyces luteireticuli]|uniref:hypothetical protein n=1 Tax=Streptomyces luteireticuli TaxID=173858 RepID=UPI003557C422
MSYPQPGPYGQPPQQPQGGAPNPYAQGGAPGAPGYGYPPPPAQPGPYGAPPQAPYGQPPQPNPYGQQPGMPGPYPPPVPPQKGGAGKTVAIVLGALVLVGAIVGGAVVFMKKDGGGGGGTTVASDGKKYKLTAPETVAGEYTKASSATGPGPNNSSLNDIKSHVTNPETLSAQYRSGTGLTAKSLYLTGVYGEIKDPEAVVDAWFADAKDDAKKKADSGTSTATVEFEGDPQKVTPEGLDNAVMKCQKMKSTPKTASPMGPKSMNFTVCIWGDHSTVGNVVPMDLASMSSGGQGMSIDDAAALAAKVRHDSRVEVK